MEISHKLSSAIGEAVRANPGQVGELITKGAGERSSSKEKLASLLSMELLFVSRPNETHGYAAAMRLLCHTGANRMAIQLIGHIKP